MMRRAVVNIRHNDNPRFGGGEGRGGGGWLVLVPKFENVRYPFSLI